MNNNICYKCKYLIEVVDNKNEIIDNYDLVVLDLQTKIKELESKINDLERKIINLIQINNMLQIEINNIKLENFLLKNNIKHRFIY